MSTPDDRTAGVDDEPRFRRLSLLVVCASFPLLLSQAFVPEDTFVLRSDDAYYYFMVAASYPSLGFWSFDSIHATNGVQPLWALILTVVAQVASWVGLTDPPTLARLFVALAALCHFGAGLLLFLLLSRVVSVGTGLAAAGGLLFPLAITWQRVWGLENALYGLLLTATAAFLHLGLRSPTFARAVALGVLLGLTGLARLNAGLLAPCVLAWVLFFRKDLGNLWVRLRVATLAGAVAALIVSPYFALNLARTGHVLPVSGAVKRATAQQVLQSWGVDHVASAAFVKAVLREKGESLRDFVNYRVGDGLWITGARVPLDERMPIKLMFSAVLLLPLVRGRPREWLHLLRTRLGRLVPFVPVLAFALVDTVLSIALYPHQIGYAITRWWLVPLETVIVVLVGTVAAAAVGYLAGALTPGARRRLLPAALAFLVLLHAGVYVRHYAFSPVQKRQWSLSWNDDSLRAAEWMGRNLAPEALVGSWNAGVVGYYSPQRVVNLDGLINNFELLPYLRDRQVARYITKKRIEYLSDMDGSFDLYGVRRDLALTEVYSRYSPFMKMWYRIYRVDGPAHDRGAPQE